MQESHYYVNNNMFTQKKEFRPGEKVRTEFFQVL